jgi:transcriptional regulator with XRE-family HTH domain
VVRTSARFITGEAFKRARVRLGLTQVQAADMLGVDETTVQRWESGDTKKVRRLYLDKLRDSAGPKA